jgi:hypothetical protein
MKSKLQMTPKTNGQHIKMPIPPIVNTEPCSPRTPIEDYIIDPVKANIKPSIPRIPQKCQ